MLGVGTTRRHEFVSHFAYGIGELRYGSLLRVQSDGVGGLAELPRSGMVTVGVLVSRRTWGKHTIVELHVEKQPLSRMKS